MERKTGTQLELFSNENENQGLSNTKNTVPFFKRIRTYEKIILVIIAIFVIGIVAFSLGVEQGKRLGYMQDVKKDVKIEALKTTPTPKPLPTTSLVEKQNYIIQIGSFKSKEGALKEANNLKRKGFSPLLFKKENYIILCVGSFTNNETAQSALTTLKKYYKGCYIRRL